MDPQQAFQKAVWHAIPSETDVAWVERVAKLKLTGEPLGDFGEILRGMLEKGVAAAEIARLAKIIGYETAFSICYYLGDDTPARKDLDPDFKGSWGMFETDENGRPVEQMMGLYESLLSFDPCGREMMPG